MHILYVEDTEICIRTVQRAADYAHHNLITARTGKAGLAQLSPSPDLVLVDLGLPDISGLEVVAQIHQALPDVPIVAVTASALEDERERCLAAGCVEYVVKPITPDQVFALFTRWDSHSTP
jgi:CheY-like chemotaxis protein